MGGAENDDGTKDRAQRTSTDLQAVLAAAWRLVLHAERSLHRRGRQWRPDAAWERSREGTLALLRTLNHMEQHAKDLRWRLAEHHHGSGEISYEEIAAAFGISSQAVSEALRRRERRRSNAAGE